MSEMLEEEKPQPQPTQPEQPIAPIPEITPIENKEEHIEPEQKSDKAKESKDKESVLPQNQDQPIKVFMWGSCEVDQYDPGDAPCPEGSCRSAVPIPLDSLLTLNESVKSVHCGALHTFLLTTFGRVFSFGCNDDGVLGRTGPESQPGLVPLPIRIDLLSTGDSHCVCGNSLYGQLFHWGVFRSTSGNMIKPQREPQQLSWNKTKNIEEIASGSNHCLIRTKEGKVYVCGDPECQVLGRVPGQRRRIQQALEFEGLNLRGVKQIWTGGNHAFAKVIIKKKGVEFTVIKAWGSNNYGQLGLGNDETEEQIMVPRDIPGIEHEKVVCIQGGEHHSIAVLNDGGVWAWGRNDEGELGIELKKEENIGENEEEKRKSKYIRVPTKIAELEKEKMEEVVAGPTFNFVIGNKGTNEQKVFSWGNGDLYMLANGKEENERTPYEVKPGFFKKQIIVQLSLGAQHGAYLVKENQDVKDPAFDQNELLMKSEIKQQKKSSKKIIKEKKDKEIDEEQQESEKENEEKKVEVEEQEEQKKEKEEQKQDKKEKSKSQAKKLKAPNTKKPKEQKSRSKSKQKSVSKEPKAKSVSPQKKKGIEKEKKEKEKKEKADKKEKKEKQEKDKQDKQDKKDKKQKKEIKEKEIKDKKENKDKKDKKKIENVDKIEEEKQENEKQQQQKKESPKKKGKKSPIKKRLHDDAFNEEENKEVPKPLQKLQE